MAKPVSYTHLDVYKRQPATIHLLQQSTRTGSYEMFKQYTDLVDKENHGNLRALMDFK